MPTPGSGVTMVDGQMDWSGGVNSIKPTTIASAQAPGGLARNELAWLVNATTRDGGILNRTGWVRLGMILSASNLYQGGFMYEPLSDLPYLIVNASGHTFQVIPDLVPLGSGVIDLTANFPATLNPAAAPFFNYAQGEQFLVTQIGDAITLPLIWDGAKLRRSKGITNPAVAPGTPGVNEIPAATAMDYYQGRLWYAQGRSFGAGDMVNGPSGTLAYGFRDAILDVTENPLVVGGDNFVVPSNEGNIRALFHTANINTQLGQGPFLIGTRKAIYQLQVPVTRTDWIAATNTNQPLMTPAQLFWGPVNDRCIVKVNGDAYYHSLEPAIRSFFMSLRDFSQWANVALSSNIQRILAFDNRSLLSFTSGTQFDGRLLMTQLPRLTPQGVVHSALAVLDFVPISSFGTPEQPTWEGIYQGLDHFQLFNGDFGGRERCFSIVREADGSIALWELTDASRWDFAFDDPNGRRTTYVVEFPAYTWNEEFLLKQLVSGELWVDKIFGEVVFRMEYRPDGDPCWKLWHEWKVCSARNSCEDVVNPVCYPLTEFREGYRPPFTLPKPKPVCEPSSKRPSDIGYQFQCRLTVHGWCRVRGLILHALPVEKKLYHNLPC